MNSAERIKYYCESTEQEPRRDTPAGVLPPVWPSEGGIAIKEVVVEYKENEPVLKSISLDIPAKAKIGIAGR